MPLSQSIARVIRAMSVIATLILLYTLTVRPSPVPEHSPAQQPQRTLDEPPERDRGDCQSQPVRVVAVAHGRCSPDGQLLCVSSHIREIESCAVFTAKTKWCAVPLIDAVFTVDLVSRDTLMDSLMLRGALACFQ